MMLYLKRLKKEKNDQIDPELEIIKSKQKLLALSYQFNKTTLV